VRGHWVQTSVEEIHAALEFYKNRRGGEVTAREIVRMALGAADTSAGIHFEGVRATAGSARCSSGSRQERDRAALDAAGLHRRAAARIRRRASPGSSSCAAGSSARASPTTWVSARRSRRSR
jgi:hypothetical protein